MTYLTHASDPRHNGVVKEVEFLSCLAEEEVNLVVVAYGVAYWLALLDVSRPDKDWICQKKRRKKAQSNDVADDTLHLYYQKLFLQPLFSTSLSRIWKEFVGGLCHAILEAQRKQHPLYNCTQMSHQEHSA